MDVSQIDVDALDLKPETRRIVKQAIRVVKSIDALEKQYRVIATGGCNE